MRDPRQDARAVSVVSVALPVAHWEPFDYWAPEAGRSLDGAIVRVMLGSRRLVGVVVGAAAAATLPVEKLQPIEERVDTLPRMPADLIELAQFVSRYYQQPLGLVLGQMIPPTVKRAGARKHNPVASDAQAGRELVLNRDQRAAADAISACESFAAWLLQGVTGSGKTEVYITAARHAIEQGGQVLMMVPEINLTPQLEQRLRTAFPGREVVTMHSRLAAGQRHRAFVQAAAGDADLVLGTRLSVFAPLPRLALVIVDEEHDASYKQQDNVRYHARDVAVWRARQRNVPVVLGSATPSLESVAHASSGRYRKLLLPARAVPEAAPPSIRFAPARKDEHAGGLGAELLDAIGAHLSRGEQSLVFVNRRGFAPSLLCGSCGWRAECPNCSARLVVHRDDRVLRCHHCNHSQRLPRTCPDCGNVDLLPLGFGTQRLENALRDAFPEARIARIDRDTTRAKGAFAAFRDEIEAGSLDILVGTQMLAKGHDFPRLTLVAVLGADNALYSADFRATERLGALLFQVSGRAGRADLPGEVIVATDFPGHALYRTLAAHDYDALTEALMAERRVAGMPPYAHLALLSAESPTRAHVDAFADEASRVGRDCARTTGEPVVVFPPVPATLARRAGMERSQVLVQSTARSALQRFLPHWRGALEGMRAGRVRWALDVDPITVS